MKSPAFINRPGKLRMPALLLALCMTETFASELVYFPVNPSFGGSPLNGVPLLNSALATNKHKDPEAQAKSAAGLTQKTPLQQFNDTLERSILSQLASSASSKITGAGGKLVPGSVETGNFRIDIVDSGGGVLTVTTTDKVTGAATSFQVGQ